jgi:hypothetical protein
MNRPLLAIAFFAAASAALVAQQAIQSSPYSGVSNPPPDDSITSSEIAMPVAKPPASHPIVQAPVTTQAVVTPSVQQMPTSTPPDLSTRIPSSDPDGDVVRPAPLPPGQIAEGALIRVRLLSDLSSSFSEAGGPFRARVATDVLQDGNVVIPAGAEISGTVANVSTGHFGGHGSLQLRPETVTLPNGESFRLHAMVSSTPGTHTHVNAEGTIAPNRRVKRATIEYAGGVGVGAITGAYLGGPVGALAGGLVGAGLVTTHLLVSHAQANLNSGSVLMLSLTQQVSLVSTSPHGE